MWHRLVPIGRAAKLKSLGVAAEPHQRHTLQRWLLQVVATHSVMKCITASFGKATAYKPLCVFEYFTSCQSHLRNSSMQRASHEVHLCSHCSEVVRIFV